MFNPDLTRRLFSSPVFLFLYYSFFFGIITQAFTAHRQPMSLHSIVVHGVPFGAVLTVMTLIRIKKTKESTGLTEPTQQQALLDAIKTGELPNDPAVRKALPAYLQERPKVSKKNNLFTTIFLTLIVIVNTLYALGDHNAYQFILSVALVIILVASYNTTKKASANIESLYSQLGLQPEAPATAVRDKKNWIKIVTYVVAPVVLILLIALLGQH